MQGKQYEWWLQKSSPAEEKFFTGQQTYRNIIIKTKQPKSCSGEAFPLKQISFWIDFHTIGTFSAEGEGVGNILSFISVQMYVHSYKTVFQRMIYAYAKNMNIPSLVSRDVRNLNLIYSDSTYISLLNILRIKY